MPALRFQLRLFPLLGTLCMLAVFVSLGQWQQGKGERLQAQRDQYERRSALAPISVSGSVLVDAIAFDNLPITARGEYQAKEQFYLDNRQEEGVAGFQVVTPLKLEGSTTRLLVNRGWMAWPGKRGVVPQVAVPQGIVKVTGLASRPADKKFLLMTDPGDERARLWMQVDLQRVRSHIAAPIQPIVLLQHSSDASDTLVRHWPAPQDRVAMHKGYALQWFGMAIALVVFFVFASLKRSDDSIQANSL
jgi:surfeit locus 1 family protein